MTNKVLVELLARLNAEGTKIWMSEDGWKAFTKIISENDVESDVEENVG